MPGTGSSFTEGSTDALFATVYARLKAMAARQLDRRQGATLDTTELVHELYLRIGQNEALNFEHPAQFFAGFAVVSLAVIFGVAQLSRPSPPGSLFPFSCA